MDIGLVNKKALSFEEALPEGRSFIKTQGFYFFEFLFCSISNLMLKNMSVKS
jgi:hypothetical protein